MSREILALQMHPMQKAVTGEELYKAVEQALVTATCQVSQKQASCISPTVKLYAPLFHAFQQTGLSIFSVASTMTLRDRHACADLFTASSISMS